MSLVPYVVEDTGRGERAMDIYSRLLKDRIVLIGQEITDQLANVVIAQLLYLMTEDPKKDIQIFINSPGGYITAGLAIFDTIRFLGCDVSTYCIGQAASMGALLLAAGTKGKRRSLPHGRIMIHQPSGGIMGTSADIKLQADEIVRLKSHLTRILSECTGQDEDKILEDSDRDYFMSPEQAIEYGLIDEMVTTKVF
ncbi:MAG: ATP-dependent Clp protease proteolytic subunit [Chlamydiales bacterium]|nr:ATP-dependent Clp protease proteolytic subunit [Chlamydiales bacterium]MCH9635051.1 ATP-dependent Clp protease proteolytic subunit [Chlamydiales bacterium]